MNCADIVVAGSGPAGLAVALAARNAGMTVLLADSARPPIDKACGEGLMPDAIAALARLGADDLRACEGVAFRGIRFLGHGVSVNATFRDGVGLGIRRTKLHTLLTERAVAAGVECRWGSPVTAIEKGVVVAGEERVAYKYLVGADGANSSVRKMAGLNSWSRNGLRLGFRRHYRIEPWSDYVEVHWGADTQLYVTPVSADCVCVALLVRDSKLRLDQALDRYPEVAARLRHAVPVGPERGGSSAFRRLHRVVNGNIALVGDASGSVDAVTGEGMSLSFRQAAALSEAISHDRLEEYQQAHERLRVGPDRMTSLLLMMDQSPVLCRRALRALANRPEVFSRMLEMHVGEPSRLRMAGALWSLGWGLLTA